MFHLPRSIQSLLPLVLGATCLASSLAAPVAMADPMRMQGIGIALPVSGTPGGTLYVPINLHVNFRLEPGIGFVSASSGTEALGETKATSKSTSSIGLSLGALYQTRPSENFNLYAGPRLGVVLNSGESNDGTTTTSGSATNVVALLAVGGEHYFSERFSLGAEADLGYLMAGEPTVEVTPAPAAAAPAEPKATSSAVSTGGQVFFRFFF